MTKVKYVHTPNGIACPSDIKREVDMAKPKAKGKKGGMKPRC